MLDRDDLARWARVFGAADEQIRRDHLLSHVLAALSEMADQDLVFYGGTALARTHLPMSRLSEDLDLLARPRREWTLKLERRLPPALRRHFGTTTWAVPPTTVPEDGAIQLVAGQLQVRIQLGTLDPERARWPVEPMGLEMRYRDVPSATLNVPTRPSFVAMKTLAFVERQEPRDLADLAGLADKGALDAAAAQLLADQAGWRPQPPMFERLPQRTRAAWHSQLANQMAAVPDPDRCLQKVRRSWSEALAWETEGEA